MLVPSVEVAITATSTRNARRCLAPRNVWYQALLVDNVLVVAAVVLTLILEEEVLLIIVLPNTY